MPVVTLNFTHTAQGDSGGATTFTYWLYSRETSSGATTQRASGVYYAGIEGEPQSFNVTANVSAFTPTNPVWLAAAFRSTNNAGTGTINENVGSRALTAVAACTITAVASESNDTLQWLANRSITGLNVTEASGGKLTKITLTRAATVSTNLSRRPKKIAAIASQALATFVSGIKTRAPKAYEITLNGLAEVNSSVSRNTRAIRSAASAASASLRRTTRTNLIIASASLAFSAKKILFHLSRSSSVITSVSRKSNKIIKSITNISTFLSRVNRKSLTATTANVVKAVRGIKKSVVASAQSIMSMSRRTHITNYVSSLVVMSFQGLKTTGARLYRITLTAVAQVFFRERGE